MKKVIITGATSMIGIHLIQYMLENDIYVLAIARENSSKLKYLNQFKNNKNFTLIECSLENICNLQVNKLDLQDFDCFFHLGWFGTSRDMRDNYEIQKLNISYTLDCVNLANKLNCKTFIGAGSQAEFGRIDGIINEDMPINPEIAYGKCKNEACIASKDLCNKLGIKHIWTRIFSVYGMYDGDDTMVSSCIRLMKDGISPQFTKGEQNWNYLYAKDCAKALYLLGNFGKDGQIYCVASKKMLKLYKYIEKIRDKINKDIVLKLGEIPYSKNQVMNLNVDISKLEKDTGFKEDYCFEEGIDEILKMENQ